MLSTNEIKQHLIAQKFIYPTANTYQSFCSESKGFSTYGPNGLQLKNNIIRLWRQLFIDEKADIYEIDTPILLHKQILTNSGHVAKFTDPVVTNGKTVHRADHLVENYLHDNNISIDKCVETLQQNELLELVKKYDMIEDSSNATIFEKNLMFGTSDFYLRPELAQGIMVEFTDFYKSIGKLPFGLAQVGKSYRNEISPHPFTRLREFTQAEVEYFFDPLDQTSENIINTKLDNMYPPDTHINDANNSRCVTLKLSNGQEHYIDIYHALSENIIKHEAIARYILLTFTFVMKLYLPEKSVRFREHASNELAHYAMQCWDLEIKLADGKWLECAGVSYRGCYDLKCHNVTNENRLSKYDKKLKKYKLKIDRLASGDVQKNFYTIFKNKLFDSHEEIFENVHYVNYSKSNSVNIIETSITRESDVFPHVIEPSIGIDRIIYALACNNLSKRSDDEHKIMFRLPYYIAPYEIAVFALSNKPDLVEHTKKLINEYLLRFNVYTDFSSVSIGKKYVRSDAIGIRYAITIDFDTVTVDSFTDKLSNIVTLRDSENCEQVKQHICEICNIINNMMNKS